VQAIDVNVVRTMNEFRVTSAIRAPHDRLVVTVPLRSRAERYSSFGSDARNAGINGISRFMKNRQSWLFRRTREKSHSITKLSEFWYLRPFLSYSRSKS